MKPMLASPAPADIRFPVLASPKIDGMRLTAPRLSLITAQDIAQRAHEGQRRKYTGEPYWHHCQNVARQVAAWNGTDVMIAAAWLHDTLEDTDMTITRLVSLFGWPVTNLVMELTDVYTKVAYPHLNRAERKRLEADRIGFISLEARVIKLADLADNTSDIVRNDPGFAGVYLAEKVRVLAKIGLSLNQWRVKCGFNVPPAP